jgi:hypothetical protein
VRWSNFLRTCRSRRLCHPSGALNNTVIDPEPFPFNQRTTPDLQISRAVAEAALGTRAWALFTHYIPALYLTTSPVLRASQQSCCLTWTRPGRLKTSSIVSQCVKCWFPADDRRNSGNHILLRTAVQGAARQGSTATVDTAQTEEEIATQRALDLFPGSALYSGVCLSAIGNSTSHSEGQVLNGSVLDCRPSRGTARRPPIGDCITSCCSRRPSRHINFLDWSIVI